MDELQQQIVQLVQAAMSGDQQAAQQIQNIMQAAQQGDQQAAQIAQMIQAVAQQMQQQQVRAARFGAKLNYIKQLNGQCPEGYEMNYYKEGGQLCKRCMKKQNGGEMAEKTPTNPTQQFKQVASAKCGKKMKKKEEGGSVEVEKCGGKPKLKKKACGGQMKKAACGDKMKAEQKGGRVALKKETSKGEPYERTTTRRWADGTTSRREVSEGGTAYTGRRGEVGITNVPNDRQNAIADSLHRADWSKRTAPRLKKRK